MQARSAPATDAAKTLGEGAGQEVDAILDVEEFRRAAAVFTHRPEAVRVVQQEEGSVAVLHLADFG